MGADLKDYFVVRNGDRAGLILGIVFAIFGWWFVTVFPDSPADNLDQISVAAICGMIGFGVSRTIAYGLPASDAKIEAIISKLNSLYQGLWFGCWMAVSIGFGDLQKAMIGGVFGVLAFGGMNYLMSKNRRAQLQREGYGFDFENPVDFDSRKGRNLRRFPYLMIFAVGYIAYFNGDPIRTLGAWALWLCLIPPIYPSTNSVLWKLIGYLWVAFCFGVVTYIEFAF